MINRDNWLDVKKYLEYLKNVQQLDDKTIKRRWDQLRHLLEWAGPKPLNLARNIDPTFPVFLQTSRYDGRPGGPSPTSMRTICQVAQRFFTWTRIEMPRKYVKLNASWIDTLRPARSKNIKSKVKKHEFYTFDEMRMIAEFDPKTLLDERDQAAMAFLYLSGMRSAAFVTLPISCVHLDEMSVDQFPDMGVHTKNHKAATTFLFPIIELAKIVQDWDDKVRSQLPESAMWFSAIDRTGENLVPLLEQNENRTEKLVDGIHRICNQVGVKYKSPHKFRHGSTMYGYSKAKTMKELKALSQNLMHEDIGVTNRIYGELTGEDIKGVIANMKPKITSEALDLSSIQGLTALAQIIKEHPELDALLRGES